MVAGPPGRGHLLQDLHPLRIIGDGLRVGPGEHEVGIAVVQMLGEAPQDADLTIDTSQVSLEDAVTQVLGLLNAP